MSKVIINLPITNKKIASTKKAITPTGKKITHKK